MARKPLLTIEANLKWNGNDMFPKPGKSNFQILSESDKKGPILLNSLLIVRQDKLSKTVTSQHVYGKMTIEFFPKDAAKSKKTKAYKKHLEDEAAQKTRIKTKTTS